MRKIVFLLALLVGGFVSRAEAVEYNQSFMVKVGVFDAGVVNLNYNENKNNYLIATELKTDNFFAKIYPFFGRYEAEGLFIKDGVKPIIYRNKTKSRSSTRTKTVFYDNKGVAYKRVSTKDDKKNEKPIINVYENVNAADLQTILAEMFKKVIDERNCELSKEVYDGKKHYRVVAKNEGVENRWFDFMRKNVNAYKCSLFIENLKENNDNILWDVSAETPINLWFDVDVKAKMPKILEIRIDSTPLGEIQVSPSNLWIK